MLDVVPEARAQRWPRRRAADVRSPEPVPPGSIRVLKFGGSSLATPDRIRDVVEIALDAAARAPIVVVVSAFHSVTNQLIECAGLAGRRQSGYEQLYDTLAARHRASVDALLGADEQTHRRLVDDYLHELQETLARVARTGSCPVDVLDAVASVGERLSAVIA